MTELAIDLLPDPVLVLDGERTLLALDAAELDVLDADAVAFVGQPSAPGTEPIGDGPS